MLFSRLLQNIQKIKYTNNNLYHKNEYIYYKLMQNKIQSTIKSTILLPKTVSLSLLNYRNTQQKLELQLKYNKYDNNFIENKKSKSKSKSKSKINIKNKIVLTMIGTTIILVSCTSFCYYIIISNINLLFYL